TATVGAVEGPGKNLLSARMLLGFRCSAGLVRRDGFENGGHAFHFGLEADVVIPFVLNRKWLNATGDGVLGKRPDIRLPVVVDGTACFVITAKPTKNSLPVLFGIFDGIVDVDEAGAGVNEFLDFLDVTILDDGMSAAAVHEEHNGLGVRKGLRVF